VKGEAVQVTEANYVFLRGLSEEFGFDTLFAECALFEESYANICDNSSTSRYSAFVIRLCRVEERQPFLEQSIVLEMNKIRSLVEKNDFLVQEVTRLSVLCVDLDHRLSNQAEVL
jgi:hypothetical protein